MSLSDIFPISQFKSYMIGRNITEAIAHCFNCILPGGTGYRFDYLK